MSRCEACDAPPPDGKGELCPGCARDLRDFHEPGCVAGWLEELLDEYPEVGAWLIRRKGGIPAEDISVRGVIEFQDGAVIGCNFPDLLYGSAIDGRYPFVAFYEREKE